VFNRQFLRGRHYLHGPYQLQCLWLGSEPDESVRCVSAREQPTSSRPASHWQRWLPFYLIAGGSFGFAGLVSVGMSLFDSDKPVRPKSSPIPSTAMGDDLAVPIASQPSSRQRFVAGNADRPRPVPSAVAQSIPTGARPNTPVAPVRVTADEHEEFARATSMMSRGGKDRWQPVQEPPSPAPDAAAH